MEGYQIVPYGELVEVGDIILIKTALGVYKSLITRVTKTSSFSLRESDGYEHMYQREVSWNMHKPKEKWNTIDYTVFRKLGE